MQERELLKAVRSGRSLIGNPDLKMRKLADSREFDGAFELQTGGSKIQVFVEAKTRCTAVSIAAIAPWFRRAKALLQGASVALLCESLPESAQEFCIENDIDFLDLAGNVSINVPGVLLIRRVGRRGAPRSYSAEPTTQNPFSGRSSRVVRVLLEKPRSWRGIAIAEELLRESEANVVLGRKSRREMSNGSTFVVDRGSISRVIRRLEDDLLVRRRGAQIVVPEPQRLLRRWAERYEERYRWRLRSSFLAANAYGSVEEVAAKLRNVRYAFTGVAAAAVNAPYVDAETLDLFVASTEESVSFRKFTGKPSGPRLRVILPYDIGVFMYARIERGTPIVSPIQAYLDAYATGGRARKQAEYLLENVILAMWETR